MQAAIGYGLGLWALGGFGFRGGLNACEKKPNLSAGRPTCNPKPYKIVGYDPLIIGSNPSNGRFLDSEVSPKLSQALRACKPCMHVRPSGP